MRRLPAGDGAAVVGGQGQSYADALRAFDDVGVGHDVAVGIDDDSGADGVLAHDESGLRAVLFVQRAIAGDENLNHRGGYFGGETFQGIVDLHEELRLRWRIRPAWAAAFLAQTCSPAVFLVAGGFGGFLPAAAGRAGLWSWPE